MSVTLSPTAEALKQASARLITDSAGRTLFYPNGPKRRGYVVPDNERAQGLRDGAKRLNDMRGYAVPFFVVLIAPCFYWFFGTHPLLTVGLLFPVLIACGSLLDWATPRIVLGTLLDGLEAVAPQEPSPLGRFKWINLWPVAAVPIVVWLMLHSYDQRIASISDQGPVTYFYGDLSWPILLILVGTAFGAVLVVKRQALLARFSAARLTFGIAIFALMGVSGVFWTIALFDNPTAKIVLTDDTLVCDWRARLSDIANVEITDGTRGSEKLRIDFQDVSRKPATCEITGLNVDYRTAYDAIYARWIAHRSDPPRASVAPKIEAPTQTGTDGLPPSGATKEQVRALLGKPTIDMNLGSDASYYFRFTSSSPPSERRIVAVYFDGSGRASEAIEYGLRDGRMFDYTHKQLVAPRRGDFPVLNDFLHRPARQAQ